MSCVWKPTTSCSAGPSDVLALPVLCQNHPAQTVRNENNIKKLRADAAAACRTASARAAESAVTAKISGDRSVGTAHCGDYVYYRQTWQLRSTRHLSVVSYLASFSGANLPYLTGGSTLWFFIVKVFALTRQPELHPACFLILMWARHTTLRLRPGWKESICATWRWLLTTIFHLLPLIIEQSEGRTLGRGGFVTK